MKTDSSFTLTTVLVLAGVVISLVSGGETKTDANVGPLADVSSNVQVAP